VGTSRCDVRSAQRTDPAWSHRAFGGHKTNGQNLSEWKQGGFRESQKQQERRRLVRHLTEGAGKLNAHGDGVTITDRFSAVRLV
jgi:hypothetical protein